MRYFTAKAGVVMKLYNCPDSTLNVLVFNSVWGGFTLINVLSLPVQIKK
jgi:hypothetical protein